MPAIDRMVFVQGLFEIVEIKIEIKRSFKNEHENLYFPVTASDSSHTGLGFEYFADSTNSWENLAREHRALFEKLLSNKNSDLQNLCGHSAKRSRLVV
jgi:hypothetical protein